MRANKTPQQHPYNTLRVVVGVAVLILLGVGSSVLYLDYRTAAKGFEASIAESAQRIEQAFTRDDGLTSAVISYACLEGRADKTPLRSFLRELGARYQHIQKVSLTSNPSLGERGISLIDCTDVTSRDRLMNAAIIQSSNSGVTMSVLMPWPVTTTEPGDYMLRYHREIALSPERSDGRVSLVIEGQVAPIGPTATDGIAWELIRPELATQTATSRLRSDSVIIAPLNSQHYISAGDTGWVLTAQRSFSLADINASRLAWTMSITLLLLMAVVVFYSVFMRRRWGELEDRAYIYHSAFYDPLTELPNRRLFERTFNEKLRSAQRLEGQVGLLFIDLDHFKTVNDDYGHQVGDHLLQLVAKRLRNVLGGSDFVARLSGDEFVAVVSYIESRKALERIEARIHGAFSQPFNLHGVNIRARCSIGHSLFPHDGSSVKLLSDVADRRMYAQKVEHHSLAPQAPVHGTPVAAR